MTSWAFQLRHNMFTIRNIFHVYSTCTIQKQFVVIDNNKYKARDFE